MMEISGLADDVYGDVKGMIDTHCHLDLEPLYSDVSAVLKSARQAGVSRFVVPGVHPDNWGRLSALAAEHSGVMAAYGVHPMHADRVHDDHFERLRQMVSAGVAVGEIGLDPQYPVSMELQEQAFRQQLRIAVAAGLPVLVHCRRAFQRTLQMLKEEQVHTVGGIMHAYSGSVEMAREFVRLGFMISVSAVITRPTAVRIVRIVRELPLSVLVLETDAPDLPPECYKGHANQPAWMVETVKAISDIKGVLFQRVAEQCAMNSTTVLRV